MKPRFDPNGVQYADNLYPDAKKRPGYYRYRRRDGSFKLFQAASIEEANAAAIEANALRDTEMLPDRCRPARDTLAFHVAEFIAYMEKLNPKLKGPPIRYRGKTIYKGTTNWRNNQYLFKAMAAHFTYLSDIGLQTLQLWWDGRTHFQQKQGLAPYRRLFNYLLARDLLAKIDFNPFTLDDSKVRLLVKLPEGKKRPPLSQLDYKKIHKAAGELKYEALQIAMGISLYTSLRQGDVCTLRFDRHVFDGELRVVVAKSEAQRGAMRAARYSWKLTEHPKLKRLIDRARELSLQNKRCPFVVSHTPERRVWNEDKEHICQVLGNRLSRMFAEAREHAFPDATFDKENPGPSFHEVRGLSSTLYKLAGYTNEQIQHLMAHEDIDTTKGYQDLESLPFEAITMKLEVEI